MSKADLFREFLEKINFHFREGSNSDFGIHFFMSQQGIKGGQTVTVVFVFPKNENYVNVKILDIATIDSPLKREELLKLLNEFNLRYRYGKFTVDETGNIGLEWTLTTMDSFNPELIMDFCCVMIECLQDEYPKIMKLQWA